MASSLEKDTNSVLGQLQTLKATTFETGLIHQAQIDQLRLWGRVAFQFVPKDGIECHIDPDKHEVHYLLKGGRLFQKFSWFRKKENTCDFKWLVGVIAALDGSVHDLLGPHWRLLITHNNKLEFEGQREKTLDEMKHEREQYRRDRNREGR